MPAHFRDADGRSFLLRGVNLSDGKLPTGQPSHLLSYLDTGPEKYSQTSYVDSPFSLEDAPTHLSRLRFLGFNALRIPVVWEALEHGGPGVYDEAYMAYLKSLVALCNEYGFRVIINAHQDLWSRFSGGSGAPLWTLHACGLDPDHFAETHAAIRHAEWPADGDMNDAGGRGKDKDPKATPAMMWTSNHNRLAPLTLYALFWGGRDFAPKCVLDGVNIQDYLQEHYLAAYGRLAEALGDLAFGYDSMNEPEPGFIGWGDLDRNEREATAKMGTAPTPAQAMRLGMGRAQTVDMFRLDKTGPRKEGSGDVRPGRGCWLDGGAHDDERWGWVRSRDWPTGTCVWSLHGVVSAETGELKKPGYFSKRHAPGANPEDPVDWKCDYWQPFFNRWAATVQRHSPNSVAFFQPPLFEPPPEGLLKDSAGSSLLAYSPHFYDALTMMKSHWHTYWNVDVLSLLRGSQDISSKLKALRIGPKSGRNVISDQLGTIAGDVVAEGGAAKDTDKNKDKDNDENGQRGSLVPTLIGETGIPFNLDGGKAYKDGNYASTVAALDAIIRGCDAHLLNYTLWTYSAINNHEWGDQWNGEDLSIHSAETGSFPFHASLAGFRAAAAWSRPFVRSFDGELKHMSFDLKTSRFTAEVAVAGRGDGEAVIFVPWVHYRKADDVEELDVKVTTTDGDWCLDNKEGVLRWRYHGSSGKVRMSFERGSGPLSPKAVGTIVPLVVGQ